MDLRQALREWNEGIARASRGFQGAFDGAARRTRQALPAPVLRALSASGIPGWQGLSRARNMQDARNIGLEAPSQAPVANALRVSLGEAMLPGEMPQAPSPISAVDPSGVRRGVEPPSAPLGPSQAAQDNQAFREALMAARAAIRTEGAPVFRDRPYQHAGQAYAESMDDYRAAQAEVDRREGVSWDQWWRHRGRQDANRPVAPEDYDFARRYRWGRAPDPNQGRR